MGRHDLTEEYYALIKPILPTNTGKMDHRWNPQRPSDDRLKAPPKKLKKLMSRV